MNTTASSQRKQTILRFDETFLKKLKYYAAREDMSLNSYAESVLRAEIERKERLPKLELPQHFSSNVLRLSGALSGKIKPEDLENDDRLAYLLDR